MAFFNAATGVVELSLDSGKFEKDSKKLNQTLKSTGSVINSLNKIAAGFLLGGSASLALFIREASEAQEVAQKFEAVFKGQSRAAEEFATELASSLGRSKTELKGFLAGLQDTFVPLGFARDEARKLSQSLTALALDVAAFNNQAESDVIRDFQSALVGNTETVRKYGIVISEARLKQEALNRGLEPKSLTEAQKAMLRFKLIMEGSADAIGTALAESAGFAGQMRRLKSSIQETSETLGNIFLPEITNIAQKLNEAIPRFISWIKANKELILSSTILAGKVAAAILIMGVMVKIVIVLTTAIMALSVVSGGFLIALGAVALALGLTSVAFAGLDSAMDAILAPTDRFKTKVEGLQKSLSKAKTIAREFREELEKGSGKPTPLQKAAVRLEKAAARLKKADELVRGAAEQREKKEAGVEAFTKRVTSAGRPALERSAAFQQAKKELKIAEEFEKKAKASQQAKKKAVEIALNGTKEEKKGFDQLIAAEEKQKVTGEAINKVKRISLELDRIALKNSEVLGTGLDKEKLKIERVVTARLKELAILKKKLQAIKGEAPGRDLELERIAKEEEAVRSLGKAKVDIAIEGDRQKRQKEAETARLNKRQVKSDVLNFTQSEKEKSKRMIKEEAARLLNTKISNEKRREIVAAAAKQISLLDKTGADGQRIDATRSSAVQAFDRFSLDVLSKEDKGLKVQLDIKALTVELVAEAKKNRPAVLTR